jgi:alcohol dehydrogenase class IV
MTPLFGALRLPASVIFGSGQRAALGMMTAGIGKRALICTDARMGGDAQFLAIVADLEAHGVATKVYDRTEADLPIEGISGCVAECAGFKPDVVLGVGGGSCMDMAKCVSVLLKHGGSLRDYYGENKIPGPVFPVIAVPTTSGTGSEVTPVAVIADTERGTKVGISSPYLIPVAAVCDPELTVSCPPGLTAVSGADALTHAIESFTAAARTVTPELTVKNVFECAQRHLRPAGAVEHLQGAAHRGEGRQEHRGARADDARLAVGGLRLWRGGHGGGARHPVSGGQRDAYPAWHGRGAVDALCDGIQPPQMRGGLRPDWPRHRADRHG